MRAISYALEVGTILRHLPEHHRENGRLVALSRAYAYGYADRLWSRAHAAWLLFRANMEIGESHGQGNRARRRSSLSNGEGSHGPRTMQRSP